MSESILRLSGSGVCVFESINEITGRENSKKSGKKNMKKFSQTKVQALEKLGMHPEKMICPATGRELTVISSVHEYVKDGKTMNLLHISVSLKNRNPNWDEMCFVKEKLLGDEMPAVQFHPPRSEYVNEHEHCLHIWASEDFSELWRRMGQKDYWRQR